MRTLRAKAGQATAEYLAVVSAVLIAVGAVGYVYGQSRCIESFAGTAAAASCKSPAHALSTAFSQSVEEVTFILNLPF